MKYVPMDPERRKRLEARGWKFGTVAEFLGLTPAEEAYIEIKLALSRRLKNERVHRHLTQHEAARRISTSQSRLAKMESCDPTVSLDLLVRALLELGVSQAQLGGAMNTAHAPSYPIPPAAQHHASEPRIRRRTRTKRK